MSSTVQKTITCAPAPKLIAPVRDHLVINHVVTRVTVPTPAIKPDPAPAPKPAPVPATKLAMVTVAGASNNVNREVKQASACASSAFHKAGFDKHGAKLVGEELKAARDKVHSAINTNTAVARFNADHDVADLAAGREAFRKARAAKAAGKKN